MSWVKGLLLPSHFCLSGLQIQTGTPPLSLQLSASELHHHLSWVSSLQTTDCESLCLHNHKESIPYNNSSINKQDVCIRLVLFFWRTEPWLIHLELPWHRKASITQLMLTFKTAFGIPFSYPSAHSCPLAPLSDEVPIASQILNCLDLEFYSSSKPKRRFILPDPPIFSS